MFNHINYITSSMMINYISPYLNNILDALFFKTLLLDINIQGHAYKNERERKY